jgi:hypothetical protein
MNFVPGMGSGRATNQGMDDPATWQGTLPSMSDPKGIFARAERAAGLETWSLLGQRPGIPAPTTFPP